MPGTVTELSSNNFQPNTVRTRTTQQKLNGSQHRTQCMWSMMKERIFRNYTRGKWRMTTHRQYSNTFQHYTQCRTLLTIPRTSTFPLHT